MGRLSLQKRGSRFTPDGRWRRRGTDAFPDEVGELRVRVVPHHAAWADGFRAMADRLRSALGTAAVDHIGSTFSLVWPPRTSATSRSRSGSWTTLPAQAARIPTAPGALEPRGGELRGVLPQAGVCLPAGGPALHVHVRVAGSPNARYALLFRDFLRRHPDIRDDWGAFKSLLAEQIDDLLAYGRSSSRPRAFSWPWRLSGLQTGDGSRRVPGLVGSPAANSPVLGHQHTASSKRKARATLYKR